MKIKQSTELYENIDTTHNFQTMTNINQEEQIIYVICFLTVFKSIYTCVLLWTQLFRQEFNIIVIYILTLILIVIMVTGFMFYNQYIDDSMAFLIFSITSLVLQFRYNFSSWIYGFFNTRLPHQD